MRANLVLLNADPIADIANTRQIAAVIRDGRYLSREFLDDQMADLVRRNRLNTLPDQVSDTND